MRRREGEGIGVSRRALLAAGVAGVAGAALGTRPRAAAAQGNLGALQPEETVEATLKRLFGGRPIKDGTSAIKLDMPLIAENGSVVPITVEVRSPMTASNPVKQIYVISDKNRRPLNARFALSSEMGAAAVGTNLRLGETTGVRVVAELADGSLLMARREVKVTVGGCGG